MKRFLLWLAQFLNAPITRSTEMPDEQIVQSGVQAAPADAAAPAVAVIGVDGARPKAESLNASVPTDVAAVAAAAPAVSDFDAFAAKLKAALKVAEVDVEHVWEEAVALAKKLV